MTVHLRLHVAPPVSRYLRRARKGWGRLLAAAAVAFLAFAGGNNAAQADDNQCNCHISPAEATADAEAAGQ